MGECVCVGVCVNERLAKRHLKVHVGTPPSWNDEQKLVVGHKGKNDWKRFVSRKKKRESVKKKEWKNE